MSIEPGQRAEMDQATAFLGDILPCLWRRLYRNCVTEGFSDVQALELVKTFIMSQNPIGSKGT